MKKKEKDKKKYSLRIRMLEINVGIALVSFLLCGVLFICSVSWVIGKYIDHDLDFFLKEAGENIEKRMEYMTEVLNELRSSELLMEYLRDGGNTYSLEKVRQAFSEAVDINNSSNRGDEGMPLVDCVYLFRNSGEYITDFYYAIVPGDQEKSDQIIANVWKVYRDTRDNEIGFETYCYRDGKSLYLACPVLNDSLEEQGSLVFRLNIKTIYSLMNQVGDYRGGVCAIYTKKGNILVTYPKNVDLLRKDWEEISHNTPYIGKIGAEEYRLYNHELCMDLRVAMGIPENYAIKILYDSIDIYVVGIIAVIIAGILSFGVFTIKMTSPIEEVNEKLKLVGQRNFQAKLPDYDSKEFHAISCGFNQMTKEIDYLVNEVYEKQILIKEMELKFLQTQMNPHFMFNVLNALALQAQIDGNRELSKKISTFSQLIQAKIYRSDTEKVQIKQELEYVKYYLEIQEFRYENNLTYSIQMEKGVEEYYIPKLCIQLVVENAIVHGLEPKLGKGNVEVDIRKEDKHISICVNDNGIGFDMDGEVLLPLKAKEADKVHNRVGLNNVNNIIKLMYGNEFGIHIFSKKGKGVRVTIYLPTDIGEEI